jgi:hypothetical protein
MDKPKLTLAPPPPRLSLDVPQSLRWSDGSELHVTPEGITLIEAQAVYVTKPRAPILTLIWSRGKSATAACSRR